MRIHRRIEGAGPGSATSRPPRAANRGVALVEALVAFAVLAFGSLAVMRMQASWSADAAVAQQRSQALRFAQREVESMRAFGALGAASGVRSFADIVSSASVIDRGVDAAAQASYRISRSVAALADGRSKSVDIGVRWTDRSGVAQQVALQSVIARADPADSGALQVGSRSPAVRGARARSAAIPVMAKDLGDGRSAIKLASRAATVVLLDNRSGAVVARCAVDPAAALADLDAASLGRCVPLAGQLLAGLVRFAPDHADPSQPAAGEPLPLAVRVTLASADDEAPACEAEPMKVVASVALAGTVTRTAALAGTVTRTVPLAALPASVGAAAWAETGDRFTVYRCIVVPHRDGGWSGRSTLVPTGWTLGTGAADRRVCRYIADIDRSGAIDRNIEHPDAYVDVVGALLQQNFLVVRGDEPCPTPPADGRTHAAITTAPHQP